MDPLLKSEPLPIISVLLESVDGSGRCAPIHASPDFDAAETFLTDWLKGQISRWPSGIVPVRVRVTFPRRLVFTYDFQSDEFGLMCEPVCAGFASHHSDGASTLREQMGHALQAATNSTDINVETMSARRVARIVLAYGNPVPMGR